MNLSLDDTMRLHNACPSHCCIEHGCKYSYDDCPVMLGYPSKLTKKVTNEPTNFR